MATPSTAVQKWYKCGELSLPPPYTIQGSQSPSNAKLRSEGEGGGGGDWEEVVIRGGELFCRCPPPPGQGLVQVTITITNGTTPVAMSASIAVLCSDMLAQCHAAPTLGLLVSPEARVKVLGEQASVNKLKLSKEMIGKGIARVAVTSVTSVTSRADRGGECKHQHAQLEMHTNLKGHWNTLDLPAVKQMIPFDVCSCVESLSSADIPVLISLDWLSGLSMINKHHLLVPPAAAANSIHASTGDGIHSEGGTPASSLQAEAYRASSLQAGTHRTPASSLQAGTRRTTRQAGEPLHFSEQSFSVSVAENAANSSVVTTVLAVGGSTGGVTYSMIGERNSLRVFSIESNTGVIRTIGEGVGGGGAEWASRVGVDCGCRDCC